MAVTVYSFDSYLLVGQVDVTISSCLSVFSQFSVLVSDSLTNQSKWPYSCQPLVFIIHFMLVVIGSVPVFDTS